MFEQMIESAPARRRSAGQAVVSVALHAALVAAAIRATSAVAAPSAEGPNADTLIWTTDPASPADAPPARSGPADGGFPPAPPDDRGAPPIPDLEATGIPPLPERLMADARRSADLLRSSLRAGPAAGAGPAVGAAETGATPDSARIFSGAELDRTVEVIEQPAPVYPPALREAGVRGYADLEFVVGRDGRVEAPSVVIRGATHPAFGESARAAIVATRFRPALFRGRAVRQLVRQRVRFDLTTATAPTS